MPLLVHACDLFCTLLDVSCSGGGAGLLQGKDRPWSGAVDDGGKWGFPSVFKGAAYVHTCNPSSHRSGREYACACGEFCGGKPTYVSLVGLSSTMSKRSEACCLHRATTSRNMMSASPTPARFHLHFLVFAGRAEVSCTPKCP